MRKIPQKVWSYPSGSSMVRCERQDVREGTGAKVNKYSVLVEKVASLAFRNPELLLFFRGQSKDYPEGKPTSIYPAIFRSSTEKLTRAIVERNYLKLAYADQQLLERIPYSGITGIRIRRSRLLRWAILQHYEVCATPYLDITSSLRVACSFAYDTEDSGVKYLMVLGFPQITGSISVSPDQEIQVIRLLSVCPPSAKRPHFQEAFVACQYPVIEGVEDKQLYITEALDFSRRLLCKFILPASGFSDMNEFPVYEHSALYQDGKRNDKIYNLAQKIKQEIKNGEHKN